jgi:hypothetical protein
MMAALKYERIAVPGTQALAEWEKLKSAGRGWPVIIGGDSDLARLIHRAPKLELASVAELTDLV